MIEAYRRQMADKDQKKRLEREAKIERERAELQKMVGADPFGKTDSRLRQIRDQALRPPRQDHQPAGPTSGIEQQWQPAAERRPVD